MTQPAGTSPQRKKGRAPVWLSTRDRVVVLPLVPIALVLICLSLIVVQKIHPEWVDSGRGATLDALSPMLEKMAVPVDGFLGWVDGMSDLWRVHEENQALRAENDRLRQWQQMALRLDIENRALGAITGYQPANTNTIAVVRVIADQASFFNQSVLAAIGASNGIRKNQPVIDDRGVVGRVQDVGQHSARILLVTDSTSHIPVIIERTGKHALALGTNRMEIDLDFADDQTASDPGAVQIGDRLLTSGSGGIFPAGLLLGVVTSVNGNTPQILPAAHLAELMMVRIIASGDVDEPRLTVPPSLIDEPTPPTPGDEGEGTDEPQDAPAAVTGTVEPAAEIPRIHAPIPARKPAGIP